MKRGEYRPGQLWHNHYPHFGNSLKKIGEDAFSHCSSIMEVEIPKSVTEIGVSAFWNTNIQKAVINCHVEHLEQVFNEKITEIVYNQKSIDDLLSDIDVSSETPVEINIEEDLSEQEW